MSGTASYTSSISWTEIQAAALAQGERLLRDWFPAGRKVGHEFKVGNLNGDRGASLSINLDTGKWADFADRQSGHDLIDLRAALTHTDRVAAARELGGMLGIKAGRHETGRPPIGPRAMTPAERQRRYRSWTPMIPSPPDAPPPDPRKFYGYSMVHDYRGQNDELLFYVRRREATATEKKQFHPLIYGALGGVTGWQSKQPPAPKALYGLNRLRQSHETQDVPVLLCEGEKSANAAQDLFPDYACLSWCGGAQSAHLADVTPLAGRNVIIWPDNDAEGAAAASALHKNLPKARVLRVDDLPPSGDAADISPDDPDAWLQQHLPTANGPDEAAALTAALSAHAWAALQIPRQDRLLGELITPGTRTFLVGSTGVGKTMIGYEIAGAMASGGGFLHWTCDRASRWIIIDGEMPDALIKIRTNDVLRRHAVPADNLIIYSPGREVACLPSMPPLNTPEGHTWVLKLAEIWNPDGILFDNLMSLCPGNHTEPDTWLQTVPLVMELTRRGMAQVWCDHTGWNTERQFGTSTKAWIFDTVGILKTPPEDMREPHALTLTLTFDLPYGKCRRRTPDNQNDFKTIDMVLRNGVWTATDATTAPRLTPTAEGWLRDIVSTFAIPDLPVERSVSPGGVSFVTLTISRAQLRDWLRKCGRIGDGTSRPLTDKERRAMSDWLTKLREAGKIGIDGDWIWLT
jgi:AAA domain/Domain of unknown function (DUF6371)